MKFNEAKYNKTRYACLCIMGVPEEEKAGKGQRAYLKK